jgi:hypothetical protein
MQAFGSNTADTGWNAGVDLDGSGVVDAADLKLAVSNYGANAYAEGTLLHIITATSGPGGAIFPESAVPVPDGGSRTFLISPEKGYSIDEVLIDGVAVSLIDKFIFHLDGVIGDHTIEVRFVPTPELADELAMRLEFNGDFKDASGWENNGVSSSDNTPSFTRDRYRRPDKAGQFDGLNDFVRVEDSVDFTTPEYTLTAWVYGQKDFGTAQYIVSKNSTDSQNAVGMFAFRDCLFSCGTGYPHTAYLLKDMEQQWLHFSVVRTIWGVEFYINGQYQGKMLTSANTANTLDLIIGARSRGETIPNYAFFNGILDDVRLYNRPLSAEEIEGFVKMPGDLNDDYIVGEPDLLLLAQAYGSIDGDGNWNPSGDFDGNGQIDMADLVWAVWGFDVSRKNAQ